MPADIKIALLVSGIGSNMEAIIAAGVPIGLVAADRECRALETAKKSGIPTELIERADFGANFDREGYTEKLTHILKTYDVNLVAMAGFMTFLSPGFFRAFNGRVVNVHPSLLPQFRGDHAVRDALSAGVEETGCTVHIATEKLDDGAVLAQGKVPVIPGDNVEILHERIKEVEHRLYPQVLKDILSGTIALSVE